MDSEDFPGGLLGGIWRGVLDLCYPPHCGSCGIALAARHVNVRGLCGECLCGISSPSTPCCAVCSHPLPEGATCPNCLGLRRHVEAIVPACRYAGVVRELLHRFKYGRDECLAVPLGDLLGRALGEERLRAPSFRALVPVPLHPMRQRERGFNQAELLAGRVRGACGLPVRRLLRRIRSTAPQAGYDREERIRNLQGAFVATGMGDPGGDYLLVDDVSTTGATLDACAMALRSAGASKVFAIVVARG